METSFKPVESNEDDEGVDENRRAHHWKYVQYDLRLDVNTSLLWDGHCVKYLLLQLEGIYIHTGPLSAFIAGYCGLYVRVQAALGSTAACKEERINVFDATSRVDED